MNKFLPTLTVGLLAGVLSMGAMAADKAPAVSKSMPSATAPAADSKAAIKVEHKSQNKHINQKVK